MFIKKALSSEKTYKDVISRTKSDHSTEQVFVFFVFEIYLKTLPTRFTSHCDSTAFADKI